MKMKYLHRTIENVLPKQSAFYKGVMLSGMRQVGKSTLLKQIGEQRRYLTLNNSRLLRMAKEAPEEFLVLNPPPVTIDEVQWAPELFPALKAAFDETEDRGLVWLSGSQRLSLWSQVADKLPGRVASFDLMPFSIYERQGLGLSQKTYIPSLNLPRLLKPKTVSETWDTIFQGAWPDVLRADNDNREIFYDQLINLYIANDVVQLNSIEKRLEFQKFLAVLATRSGQELNYSGLSKDCGINLPTVKAWLSIVEASGLVFLLPPFYENIEKRLVKSPKMYFVDTGLVCFLLDIQSSEELSRYYNRGAIFETFVISEILKSWVHNAKSPSFYFYRDFEKSEVDLLIHDSGVYYPIEIKSSVTVSSKKLTGLEAFKKNVKNSAMASVISMTPEPYVMEGQVINHSIWDI